MRRSGFRTIIFLFLAIWALVACSNDAQLSWKEEVKLADGRIIVVKRYSEFKAPHELGQPSGESLTRLEFEHPVTKERVRFESKFLLSSKEKIEASDLINNVQYAQQPYALMLKDANLYVVVKPLTNVYRFVGCPDPPFLLYLWKTSNWERHPLSEMPHRQFTPNLTIDVLLSRKIIRGNNRYLSVDQLAKESSGQLQPSYDLRGMTQQTFELAPNCTSCKVKEYFGDNSLSPAGPFCNRPERNWIDGKHLTN